MPLSPVIVIRSWGYKDRTGKNTAKELRRLNLHDWKFSEKRKGRLLRYDCGGLLCKDELKIEVPIHVLKSTLPLPPLLTFFFNEPFALFSIFQG